MKNEECRVKNFKPLWIEKRSSGRTSIVLNRPRLGYPFLTLSKIEWAMLRLHFLLRKGSGMSVRRMMMLRPRAVMTTHPKAASCRRTPKRRT